MSVIIAETATCGQAPRRPLIHHDGLQQWWPCRRTNMAIHLDHLLVPVLDRKASARRLAQILGVPWAGSDVGPFSAVYVNEGLTLDFDQAESPYPVQHYAFRVGEPEFAAILARIRSLGIAYRSLPHGPVDMKVETGHGGSIVYWEGPDIHHWEMLTVSYARPRTPDIAAHYTRGDLLQRLNAALTDDGADPARPSMEALAPYDQFHGRGLEATMEVAALVRPTAAAHILDIGSGIGGPARYFASRFGCRVSGIDLTAEFCEVARHLTRLLGLQQRADFHAGNALAMPFGDAAFDGAYSMNVSMNIADKAAFYREIHRVLRPGAWLVLSELARGDGPEIDYPTPWAASAGSSFLATPEETRQGLVDAGFVVEQLHDTLAQARAFGAQSRALVERGEKPPHRAVMLIHGGIAAQAMANSARGLQQGSVLPIEVLARKSGAARIGR
jgi:SAM-dependent methyltransferase